MVKIISIFGSCRFLRIAWHDIFELSHHLLASWNLYIPVLRSRRANAHRVLLKAGPQPGGPVLIFHSFFCPAVNPRACTDLHRVWACKMDDGEFEFVYHFNHLNLCFCLLHVVQIRTFPFSVHSSIYRNL